MSRVESVCNARCVRSNMIRVLPMKIGRVGVVLRRLGIDLGLGLLRPVRGLGESLLQFPDTQVLRLDAIQRGNATTQHVVLPAKCARFFERQNINRSLDQAKEARITPAIGANGAGRFLGEGSADGTEMDFLARGQQVPRKLSDKVRIGLNKIKGNAFGGARTDAGQFAEAVDEPRNRFRKGQGCERKKITSSPGG